MVRPIEITDLLSKAEAVQRLQQQQKVVPEAQHQFQKSLTDKINAQVNLTNPVPQGDQVLLHVDEQEREDKHEPESDDDSGGESPDDDNAGSGTRKQRGDDDLPYDHIDITV